MSDRFHELKQPESARKGTVLISSQDGIFVSSCVDGAYLEQVMPYGFYSRPCEQDEVLILPTEDGKYVLLGNLFQPGQIGRGEVMLKAKSGAYLHLKSDGSVEINGLVILPDGTIQK